MGLVRTTLVLAALGASVASVAVGCEDPAPGPRCAPVASDCAPLYEPTFAQIHARTLAPSCALGGGACHGPKGGQGGVRLQEIDEAYRTLVEDGHAGNASCSELYARLTSTDGSFRMPPGRALSDGERCAIAKWIANGAPR